MYGICTENYKDAYDFSINSWLRQDADKIIIYSDTTWETQNPRIEIKKVFSKSNQWNRNICLKAEASILALKEGYDNICFIDMDCYLRGNLSHVFNKNFDIAVTELKRKNNISTGTFFVKNNTNTKLFFSKWLSIIKSIKNYKSKNDGIPQDQETFSKVVYGFKDLNIIDLPKHKYNRKISNTKRNEKQKKDLKLDDSLVLHFYNKSFKIDSNKNEVFSCLGENYS